MISVYVCCPIAARYIGSGVLLHLRRQEELGTRLDVPLLSFVVLYAVHDLTSFIVCKLSLVH